MENFRAFARVFLALMGALSIGLLFAAVLGIREASPEARIGGLALFSALCLVLVVVLFVIMIVFDLQRAQERVKRDIDVQQAMTAENRALMEQQKAQINQLALLNKVVATLGGTLSPETLVDHVISCASVLTDATGYTIYLNGTERLELVRSIGLEGSQILAVNDPLFVLLNKGDRSEAPALIISDIGTDSRAGQLRTRGLQYHFSSVIELPLTAGGELLGLMGLFFTGRVAPDDGRLELLKAFTTQAAQALYNARRYVEANDAFQRNAERLMTLAVLSRSLSSSVDVSAMCAQVLDEVMLATGADTGLLVLIDDFATTPQIGASHGLPDEDDRYAEVVSALEKIDPARGAYIVRRDTHIAGLPPFLTPEAQSMLLVPMVQSSFLFGVIWLESTSNAIFDSEDIRFVEQISNQAVIALENARLFQRREGDRERLERLLDTMVEGIMMIDPQGDVVLANPRMSIVGLRADSLLNTNFLVLLENGSVDFAQRIGFSSSEEAIHFVMEMNSHMVAPETRTFTIVNNGIERYVERKIVPVASADSVLGLMLVFYDRTDQRALERSREDLTSMIVHDLRSPLTAVTTSLRLLHDLVPPDSDFKPVVQSTAEVSRRAVKKILNRVNSLLDIAKMQSGGMPVSQEVITFERLIGPVVEELTPLAREVQIELAVKTEGESPTLMVDIDKAERLLLNFVDNALKYSPTHTVVTIRQYAPGTSGARPGFARIDIIDQGPGIPAEYKSRLFDSFVQVQGRTSTRGGVGLGLTFAKLTVEAHGGRVWIEDNPAGGSVFAFTLPTATIK